MTTTEATAALDRLKAEREKAMEEATRLREDLDTLETTTGDRLLTARLDGDADASSRIRAELQAARDTLADAEKIVTAADRAIEAAQRDVLAAQAREIRDDVAARWPDVEARLDHAGGLLTTLHDVEGVHWLPQPHVAPSGAVAAGSWARTATGQLLADLLMDERRAVSLESRAGVTSPPSITAGRADHALHLGCQGVVEQAAPIAVHGGRLDDASAALRGKGPAQQPTPDRDLIARQAAQNRRLT
jgi:hypothetical protein